VSAGRLAAMPHFTPANPTLRFSVPSLMRPASVLSWGRASRQRPPSASATTRWAAAAGVAGDDALGAVCAKVRPVARILALRRVPCVRIHHIIAVPQPHCGGAGACARAASTLKVTRSALPIARLVSHEFFTPFEYSLMVACLSLGFTSQGGGHKWRHARTFLAGP
jgi:hypothetical protein